MKTDLKTLRPFKIRIQHPSTGTRWEAVSGYRVIIPGFEEFELFVHRLPSNEYRVSEVTTGFSLPSQCDAKTRQSTIDNATNILHEIGKEKFSEAVNKAQEVKND